MNVLIDCQAVSFRYTIQRINKKEGVITLRYTSNYYFLHINCNILSYPCSDLERIVNHNILYLAYKRLAYLRGLTGNEHKG